MYYWYKLGTFYYIQYHNRNNTYTTYKESVVNSQQSSLEKKIDIPITRNMSWVLRSLTLNGAEII